MTSSAPTPPAQGPGINDMCDEILVEIFSYLSIRQLAQSVSQVCTRWKTLIHQERRIWKYKWLDCDMSDCIDDYEKIIERIPNICCLKLNFFVTTNLSFPKVLTILPNLQRLDIKIVQSYDALSVHFIQYARLMTLMEDCFNEISNFKNLTSLRLHMSFTFCGRHLREITDKCTLLTKFSAIHSPRFTEDDMLYFLKHRKETLKKLEISGDNLGEKVFLLLAQCKKLQHLQIVDARLMTDRALKEIVTLPCLKVLIVTKLQLIKDVITSLNHNITDERHYYVYLGDDKGRVLLEFHSPLMTIQPITWANQVAFNS